MRTIGIIILGLLVLAATASCSRRARVTAHEGVEVLQAPLPERNLHFAFDLLKVLPEYRENFVVSPFSISTALAMTYAGARQETMRQMAQTLYFDLKQEEFHVNFGNYLGSLKEKAGENIQLNIANSLWAQQDYDFLPEFFNQVQTHYQSELIQVDFTADREAIRHDINQWVLEETRQKIRDLIAPGVLTHDTRMVLVNAIHFFGPWLSEFDKDLTREDEFTTGYGEKRDVPFMYRNQRLPYFEDQTMQVLEIPYTGEDFSMVIMLPKEGQQLQDIEQALHADHFLQIIEQLDLPGPEMDIWIPRWEAETKVDLEKVLSEMGMPIAFSTRADFSGMTGRQDLMIDKVIHQAMIEVAEEGTEAAAATAVVVVRKSLAEPEERILFKANRPFLFFIKDREFNSVLFMGRVNAPG